MHKYRNTLLALLVCVNLVLLTGLVLARFSLPAAYAQATGLAGNYMLVSGEIQDQYDALYLIDMRDRTLHVFTIDKGTRQIEYSDFRELERDFRNNKDNP